jgi:hypothetical protein
LLLLVESDSFPYQTCSSVCVKPDLLLVLWQETENNESSMIYPFLIALSVSGKRFEAIVIWISENESVMVILMLLEFG